MDRRRQRGMGLVLAAVVLLAAVGLLVLQWAEVSPSAQRGRVTARALAQAREALIAYAADRPIDAAVGPGYLPCPDLDNDGWAEATCGSLAGDVGQEQRLGRLPWKTLGLPDLRDGHGERLWYAVSTKHKGLLHCAASRACVDMTPPAALGTITVRDRAGHVVHDGTLADPARAADGGAAAVVLAPGPPLVRPMPGGASLQRRECAEGECDARRVCTVQPPWRAGYCHAVNFLDAAPAERGGEDNADFHDRSDGARGRNGNGFIAGPVADAAGRVAVNDRIAVVAYRDLAPRVATRVALEAALCLRAHGPAGYPAPEPACASAGPAPAYGRVPALAAGAACNLALRTSPTWWAAWKPFVFYAPAAAAAPIRCEGGGRCLELVDEEGRTLAKDRHFAVVVGASAGACSTPRLRCEAGGCTQAVQAPRHRIPYDAVVAQP